MHKKPKPFYKSKEWKKCREVVLIRDHYLCQVCLRKGVLTPANTVHHIEHLEEAPDRALEADNLESVFAPCHNQLHPEKAGGKAAERKVRRRKARVIKMVGNGMGGL